MDANYSLERNFVVALTDFQQQGNRCHLQICVTFYESFISLRESTWCNGDEATPVTRQG